MEDDHSVPALLHIKKEIVFFFFLLLLVEVSESAVKAERLWDFLYVRADALVSKTARGTMTAIMESSVEPVYTRAARNYNLGYQ